MPQNKSCVECKILKDKNLELTKSLQNFTNSKNKLDVILENQHSFHNRKGLGFNKKGKNKKTLKGSYKITSKRHFGIINCYYCNQRGHYIKDCSYRNGTYVLRPNEKLLWLPKASTSKSHSFLSTNFVGPKTTWVPSTKE